MSDENNNVPHVPAGWVKLWHQAGVLVTLPVPFTMSALMAAQIDDYLANGFCVDMPGAQAEGETKEMIGWVCLRAFERDGVVTPVVDLYADHEKMSFSVLSVYLNDNRERDAFEYASGLALHELPEYEGAGKLERGTGRTDRFIIRAPQPFAVLHKPNPKHDPNETDVKKKKPKRVFSRWADALPAASESKAPVASVPAEIDPFADDAPAPTQGRLLDVGNTSDVKCPHCGAPPNAKFHGSKCPLRPPVTTPGAFQG